MSKLRDWLTQDHIDLFEQPAPVGDTWYEWYKKANEDYIASVNKMLQVPGEQDHS